MVKLISRFVPILGLAAACTRQASTEQNAATPNQAEYNLASSSDQPTDAMNLTSYDESDSVNSFDGGSAEESGEAIGASDIATRETPIWVGMSGVPGGCTLTNYQNLADVRVVMEQDRAKLVRETSDLIIVAKSAPKGMLKLVYTTDQALCEVVITRADFSSPVSTSSPAQDDGEEK